MQRRSKKVAKHKPGVEKHKIAEKQSEAQGQTQDLETQQANLQVGEAVGAESGYPKPSITQPLGDAVNTSSGQESMATNQQSPIQPYPQAQALNPETPVSPNSTLPTTVSQTQSSQPTGDIPLQDSTPEKKSKLWIIIIFLLLVIAALSGGILFYLRSNALKEVSKEEIAASSPTQVPISPTVSQASESASIKIDYSKYEIQVLNGSGIAGEASRAKDILEGEKFVVKDIDNADSSDYEKTVIRAKKDVQKEYIDALRNFLGKTYDLDVQEVLKDSANVDVVIIIGSSKKP